MLEHVGNVSNLTVALFPSETPSARHYVIGFTDLGVDPIRARRRHRRPRAGEMGPASGLPKCFGKCTYANHTSRPALHRQYVQ